MLGHVGSRWIALLAAGLLAWMGLALPAEAQVRGGPATARLSLYTSTSTVQVGSLISVSGATTPTASTPLLLQRQIGGGWSTIATLRSSRAGRFVATVRAPRSAATWLLRASRARTGSTTAATSAVIRVNVVRSAFTVSAAKAGDPVTPAAITIIGAVTPRASGSVLLQEYAGSAWHDLATAVLSRTSHYSISVQRSPGAHRLRVVKTATSTTATGYSPAVTATVGAPAGAAPAGAQAPAITTTSLPAAHVAIPFGASLTATGTAPFNWTVANGLLPGGLSLTPSGTIYGTPTVTGSYPLIFTVTDASGRTATTTVTLTIGNASTVRGWGRYDSGQLGRDEGLTQKGTPPAIQGLDQVLAVAAGATTTYGLKVNGAVAALGDNSAGQLGLGDLRMGQGVPVEVRGLGDAVAVASGAYTGYALRANGVVVAWGSDSYGQLGDGVPAGQGTSSRLLFTLPAPTSVTAISAGECTGYAVRADGTVWAWGRGTSGELGNGSSTDTSTPVQVSGLTDVVAVSGAQRGAYALRADGTVWAWGDNSHGQLGDGTTATRLVPVQVIGLSGVRAVAAGSTSGYALRSDGTVTAWGNNAVGQLGDGTTVDRSLPVQVTGLSTVTAITAGASNGYALLTDGTVRAWGVNDRGQIGDGRPQPAAPQLTPTQVVGVGSVRSIGSGSSSSSAYAVVPG